MSEQITIPTRTKRAFVYLRVSTEEQTKTDYDRDGLSIIAQRDGAEKEVSKRGAEIVQEFSDPGKSAFKDLQKRTGFLELLEKLKRCNEHKATRIDFVIVWSCSRWARNTVDHWQARDLMNKLGVRFVSVTEPIVGDNTPAAFLYESSIVSQNQYQSMQNGELVRNGIRTKARLGGSHGPAKLGYVNDVDKLADGQRVAIVSPDPERCHFLTTAFQLFSSGEYSLSQLSDELYDLGLRSRLTRRHPGSTRKVQTSTLQRVLRDPYYAGWIVYKRDTPDEKVFPARHKPLIDEQTFNTVQALLDERRVSGERTQKHSHYLKGSVYCGECGSRLLYGLSRSKSGKRYAYYFCGARIRGTTCAMRTNIRPRLIEDAIARYYTARPVELSAKDVVRQTGAIEALVGMSQKAVAQVKASKTELITKLKTQQVRLIRLHAEEGDEVSPDAFREERLRMQQQIQGAEESLAATEKQLNLDATELRMALELAGDVAKVYANAPAAVKRGYNQAFFKTLFVKPDWDEERGETVVRVVDAELTPPYAVLLADDFAGKALAESEKIQERAQNADSGPEGAAVWWSVFDLLTLGGEGGIRTLERACAPYSLSRRVPSATRPPLRGFDCRATAGIGSSAQWRATPAMRRPSPRSRRRSPSSTSTRCGPTRRRCSAGPGRSRSGSRASRCAAARSPNGSSGATSASAA
jgi:site-specific DNA recombinase